MISIARVVLGAAALAWLTPVPWPSAAGQPALEPVRVTHEETYDGCTFRFVSQYDPADRTQYARTRQDWSEDCRFGSRDWSIRVKVCFEGLPGDPPVDCSSWSMPTADAPYAESEIEGPTPRASIHYVDIHGAATSFVLAAPELPTAASATPTGGRDPARISPAAGLDTDGRLAATLAVGGVALLGLGGAGVWLLRRSASR